MKFYPDEEVLIQDIAKAYRTVIKELYEAGCRNIQFDDCTWGMFVIKILGGKTAGLCYNRKRGRKISSPEQPCD